VLDTLVSDVLPQMNSALSTTEKLLIYNFMSPHSHDFSISP